jgi:ABC-type uncharacterized transport system substrate-binding protein
MARCEFQVGQKPAPAKLAGTGFAALAIAIGIVLSALALSAQAQTTAKVYRLGWLGHGSALAAGERSAGDFQQGLSDLGYVEGRNYVIEYRYASGNVDRLPQLAGELVALKVDVIVTAGEPAALAAKATNDPGRRHPIGMARRGS